MEPEYTNTELLQFFVVAALSLVMIIGVLSIYVVRRRKAASRAKPLERMTQAEHVAAARSAFLLAQTAVNDVNLKIAYAHLDEVFLHLRCAGSNCEVGLFEQAESLVLLRNTVYAEANRVLKQSGYRQQSP